MKKQSIGGIIAAAGKETAFPLMKLGSIPIVKRLVLSFQQAGISPIVVITGVEEYEVKYQLSDYGVIFLFNENYETAELFESMKIGLSYLQDSCDRIVFAPVNVPMFSPFTLKQLIETEGEIVTPSYKGKGGHPVLFSSSVYRDIAAYQGAGGLRGAIRSVENRRIRIAVDDEGILYTVHDQDRLNKYLEEHNKAIIHPYVRISIEKEAQFFNSRTKLLLSLIAKTHSVRTACNQMALSYGKAWEMLNLLEKQLNYSVVNRKHGGSYGGRTELTEKGAAFLQAYQLFEESVQQYTQDEFKKLFQDNNII